MHDRRPEGWEELTMKTPLRLISRTSSKSLSDMSRKFAVRTMPAHPASPAQAIARPEVTSPPKTDSCRPVLHQGSHSMGMILPL